MEKVIEGGPWRIQLVPFMLNVWMLNTLLKKDKVTHVPLWFKMHNVPIVAYSKVGLELISAKVGSLMRLDAHTNFICLNSWGRSDYARALVEVSADKPLVDSVDIDIPRDDGNGYTTANIRIEFEWQPPRCGTCKIFDHLESVCPMKRVAGPLKKSDKQAVEKKDKRLVHATGNKGKGKQVSSQCFIKGYRVNIPKSKLVYRAVIKPHGDNNVACNMEQSLDATKKPSSSDSSNVVLQGENQGKKVSSKKSSPSMEVLNEDSDTDDEEVFLPNDRTTFPSSSGGGGQPLEEDAYDDYEDQFEENPCSYQEFCDQFDFKVKGLELLKEEKKINEKWLTSSKKVSQCISEQIPHQKKKVLGGELFTESPSKMNENENLFVPAFMFILVYVLLYATYHSTGSSDTDLMRCNFSVVWA
ncbi:hypothetical protein Tco_0996236 [Tanacetum coccineum]